MLDRYPLFNRSADNGGAEIVRAIGMISHDVDFSVWAPVIPLGVRDVAAIIGTEPVAALSKFYLGGDIRADNDDPRRRALRLLQQASALFAWLKLIPTLDAQHDSGGRAARLGENEKGLTALQEWKDESNIRHLAYESTDALIQLMDEERFDFWTSSPRYRMRQGLLIRSKEEFDTYYVIGSHRLFVTLLPMIRETQEGDVAPVLGERLLRAIISGDVPPGIDAGDLGAAASIASRALALLTMKKAVERLPVEVIPEGIVQIQQSAPVSSRLKAEQSARQSVAASLGADADRLLSRLANAVADILREPAEPRSEGYVCSPLVHSKGISF